MKSKFTISEEKRKAGIALVQEYFYKERDEDLGILAAGLIFDFFMEKLAPEFYNLGVEDSYHYMNDRVEDILGLCKVR